MDIKMRDSKVEWLGEVPENWEIKRLKFLASISTGDKDTINKDENGLFPFYVRSKNVEKINTYSYDGEAILTAGDGNIGEIFHYINGKFDYHQRVYCISKINNIEGKLLYYYMSECFKKDILKYNAKTTVDSLRLPWLLNFPVVIPPMDEQNKIIELLDKKVSQIDNIIFKTKETIEYYKKYKQSLITEAVTKGIKQHIAMKNSGVDWIGLIPEHTKLIKIKYLFEIKKDIAGKEGYEILSVTQKGIKIKDISKNEGQIAQDYSKYQLVNKDDFIMNHMDLLTGWVDCSKYEGVTSPDYRVFRFINSEKHSKEYYTYLMQICYTNKIFYGLGQGVSNLGRWRLQADKFLNFVVPVPTLKEQKEIVEYLDKKCIEIDRIIHKKEKLIIELENYKKSLIYECVTGKKEI